MAVDDAPRNKTAASTKRTQILKATDFSRSIDGGSGGGRLKDGVEVLVFLCGNERLCRSAPPPDVFFGYFLVRTQESNTELRYSFCAISTNLKHDIKSAVLNRTAL